MTTVNPSLLIRKESSGFTYILLRQASGQYKGMFETDYHRCQDHNQELEGQVFNTAELAGQEMEARVLQILEAECPY